MRALSATKTKESLSLLDSGQSISEVFGATADSTSAISRVYFKHCFSLQNSLGGCPTKLLLLNMLFTFFALGRLMIRLKSQNHLLTSSINLFLQGKFVNTWRELGWELWWNTKDLFLKRHNVGRLDIIGLLLIGTGLWRMGTRLTIQMGPKSIIMAQMVEILYRNSQKRVWVIGW